jgi:serine/threonine protein phosphatase PrpC
VLERVEDLSVDHKPTVPAERKRIEAAGLSVSEGRVEGDLSLSRAIGDTRYKQNDSLPAEEQAITAMPEVRVVDLSEGGGDRMFDTFVLLACDGIWDCKSSENAAAFTAERVERIVPVASPSCPSEYGDWACTARTARSKCKGKGEEKMILTDPGSDGDEAAPGTPKGGGGMKAGVRERVDAREVLEQLCNDCLSEDPSISDDGCDNMSAVVVQLHMSRHTPNTQETNSTGTGTDRGRQGNSRKRTASQVDSPKKASRGSRGAPTDPADEVPSSKSSSKSSKSKSSSKRMGVSPKRPRRSAN